MHTLRLGSFSTTEKVSATSQMIINKKAVLLVSLFSTRYKRFEVIILYRLIT